MVLFGFCPSSNPIALKLMVERSFLDYWSLNHHSNIWSCYLRPYFGHTFQLMFNCVCFSLSIHHYIIWSDKCYLLVHITVEIHLFGYLVELLLSPSATSSSSPWLNVESLRVSSVWPLLEYHVNAISTHACGTPIFNKDIWSTMLNFLYQLP